MSNTTRVDVYFNGAGTTHFFKMDKERFLYLWDNRIGGCGYFSELDEKGKMVIINPSNCGVIEIMEVKVSE